MRLLAHQAADDASVAGATRSNSARRAAAIAGARGAELVGRDLDFRESLHCLGLDAPGAERSQLPGSDLGYTSAPRAGMAELVDAADSKSVALKRRVGSIPSPGTI